MDDSQVLELHSLEDRLGDLPDSLILVILSLLPTRDVVKTTILSHRWKDLRTTVACLDFSSGYLVRNLDPFQRFVCGALALWKGAKILRFRMYFMFDLSLTRDLDAWLHFAIENQVEELQLHLTESISLLEEEEKKYYAPQCLYSCSSITKLSLINCGLEMGKDVQWNQLNSLYIESNESLAQVINNVISGAPKLEALDLFINQVDESLDIQCTSLKVLKIHRFPKFGVSEAMLRIWAPNLEAFEISGISYAKCLLNFPSLTSALLDFLDDGENNYFLLDEMIVQVIRCISDLRKITLSDWCIKTLVQMKKRDIFVEFSNAEFVKFIAKEVGEMLGVLDLFPNMMMFIFELDKLLLDYVYPDQLILRLSDLMATESSPTATPSLLHLRRVEITWHVCDATPMTRAIAIILENAQVLEKLVFHLNCHGVFQPQFAVVEDIVLNMPKSSSTAEVNVIEV